MPEGDAGFPRVNADTLRDWVTRIFVSCKLKPADAAIAADVLVESDLRGIDSHGVPRLARAYVARLDNGAINASAELQVVRETQAAITFDAQHGLGLVMAYRAMERCIEKAKAAGVCLASVGNSDHFGIAGYYATMALKHPGMAGIAMTTATPLLVPTFGRQARLSTAPIAAAFPAGEQDPFVLDAATTTVAMGKIEIARRMGVEIPAGWALDADGEPVTDPHKAVALTPLGGERVTGGQKGYGLSLMVEMLCSQLSGSPWSRDVVYSRAEQPRPSGASHAFIAIDIDAFRPFNEYAASTDEMLADLRGMEPKAGHARVYVPGDPEAIAKADRSERGIPLHPEVIEDLRNLGRQRGIEAPV
ncbi:MAG TPA: Ldh family oxidoreductase [Thermomicrobiales bacterium]|nr:Ldh family oxidoreductase [Thermomicrobiales bacterium]